MAKNDNNGENGNSGNNGSWLTGGRSTDLQDSPMMAHLLEGSRPFHP